MVPGMNDMRKITVEIPAKLLENAQSETGKGITETVREGLERLAATRAQKALLNLEGKGKFDFDLMALRKDED